VHYSNIYIPTMKVPTNAHDKHTQWSTCIGQMFGLLHGYKIQRIDILKSIRLS
jgi:hypothetical protein